MASRVAQEIRKGRIDDAGDGAVDPVKGLDSIIDFNQATMDDADADADKFVSKESRSDIGGRQIAQFTDDRSLITASTAHSDDDCYSRPSTAAKVEEEFKVVPLKFNISTYDLNPSISPRNDVSIPLQKNQPFQVELDDYLEQHPEIEKLVALLHSEILRERPDNIVEYCWMNFFRENNHSRIRKAIRLDD